MFPKAILLHPFKATLRCNFLYKINIEQQKLGTFQELLMRERQSICDIPTSLETKKTMVWKPQPNEKQKGATDVDVSSFGAKH